MIRFSGVWYWVLIMVVVILAAGITILFGETNDVRVPEETSSPDSVTDADPVTEVELQPEYPASRGTEVDIDLTTKAELQQFFNDLRKEYLDTRAKSIDWWLEFIAIVLAFFAILIAIAGYVGFREFKRLRDEAESDAEKIKNHLSKVMESRAELERVREEAEIGEITVGSDEAIQHMRETLSAEVFTTLTNDEEFENTLRDFEQIPNLFFVDKAMIEAYKLQRDGKITDAVQKWRSVAIIVDENDKNLAARAWNSVGYLLSEEKQGEEAISAYNKAIEMKANYAEAYYNRGKQKVILSQDLDAIEDLDKAIELNFDEAKVYVARGVAKFELGEHDNAFTDFDRAIYMKPDYANAHAVRGDAKVYLHDFPGAKVDFQNALGLAEEQGKEELRVTIEEKLQGLNEME